jgi:hypothetical protein
MGVMPARSNFSPLKVWSSGSGVEGAASYGAGISALLRPGCRRGGAADRTSARMAESELRVAVGPSAARLAIAAAISSKVSATGSGATFLGNRLPP